MHETFWTLLHDAAHWEFELFVGLVEILVFDGIVFGSCWPFLRKHWKHHLAHDAQTQIQSLSQHPMQESAIAINWSLNNPTHMAHNCPDCLGSVIELEDNIARCRGCGALRIDGHWVADWPEHYSMDGTH